MGGRMFDIGFDKGPIRAERVTVDTTLFNKNLSDLDDNVQKALETLDQFEGATGPAGPTGPTGADGSPGPNQVTTATDTNITGLIAGNGAKIVSGEAPIDSKQYARKDGAWDEVAATTEFEALDVVRDAQGRIIQIVKVSKTIDITRDNEGIASWTDGVKTYTVVKDSNGRLEKVEVA